MPLTVVLDTNVLLVCSLFTTSMTCGRDCRQTNKKVAMAFQPPKKLTKAQVELLALFDRDVPDEEWMEIRRLLARYFADKATQAADHVAQEKG